MGSSSRPKDFKNRKFGPQESLDYFLDYIEKWRIEFSKKIKLEWTNFVLAGHSFGGYLAASYALKYP